MSSGVILLVEDNPDDIELTRDALIEHHIKNPLVVMNDGAAAIDYLVTCDQLPRVALLDLHLPKVDGFEVLRHIRQSPRTQLLPVVILTSSTEDRDLVESYRLGANSYVRKPVAFSEFHAAIRQLGIYWLLLNQRPEGYA